MRERAIVWWVSAWLAGCVSDVRVGDHPPDAEVGADAGGADAGVEEGDAMTTERDR